MTTTVWRGHLAFGLVSIPIRLYKAARREQIRFRHVYRRGTLEEPSPPSVEDDFEPRDLSESTDRAKPAASKPEVHELPHPSYAVASPSSTVARVKNVAVGETDESPLEKSDILKGYEIESGRYVTFDPKEIAALKPKTSRELNITEFVRLEEIDPVFFDTSYYAVADRGGEKPYALLFRALAETGYAGLGALAMHGREHAVVIRPGQQGLILHTLYYENEVRAAEQYRIDPQLVNAKELDLAKQFVRALAAQFDSSKLKDTFKKRLEELIHARAETALAAYQQVEAPARRPVGDIMEALRKSLQMARKPPERERTGAIPPANTGRSRRGKAGS